VIADAASARAGDVPASRLPPPHGYGYLQLGATVGGTARVVQCFREKPDRPTAEDSSAPAGQVSVEQRHVRLRAATLLDCIRRYEPEIHAGLMRIAQAWDGPQQHQVLAEVYPGLKKISVDFAVMERASRDPQVTCSPCPCR